MGDCEINQEENDTSKTSTEIDTDDSTMDEPQEVIEMKHYQLDSNNENLPGIKRQETTSETSLCVVRDVLQDVIKASAELSDRSISTETTDSEMDITIDKIDTSSVGQEPETESTNENLDNRIEISSDSDNREANSAEMEIVILEAQKRKRKNPESRLRDSKKTSPKKDSESVNEKHPGVFVTSNTPPQIVDLPKLRFNKKSDTELNKAILDSLPVIEKLRALSRTGSLKDDASMSGPQSEVGDNMSDKDSVASGMVTRNLRRKDSRKPPAKTAPKAKKAGLTTRSGKGRGRRNIFKKKPVKSLTATATATPVTSEKVYFKGQYFHVGDIVSVTNVNDDDIYYAQLKGFLTDEYSDKSAVITWLLPTTASPPPNEGFHPATYIIGPEEELPRKLEVFTFVMHAPGDYFYARRAPYRTDTRPTETNFTSVRLGPRLRKTVDNKDVYVGIY